MQKLFVLFFLFTWVSSAAQTDTTPPPPADTARAVRPPASNPPPVRNTPARRVAPAPKPAVTDTVRIDTTNLLIDSLQQAVIDTLALPPLVVVPMQFDSLVYAKHPFYRFTNPIRRMESKRVAPKGKEDLFYSAIGLLLFFALIRNGFSRYLNDLFQLYFRTTLKQRQAKEQIMQNPFPSLLLNLLFIISGGLFLNLVLRQFNLGNYYSFWVLFLYCCAGLALIYFGKFIALKIVGWLFRVSEAVNTYIFIVFTTNKIIGIVLLPFIILLGFTSGTVNLVAFNLSILAVAGLFLYRYFISYGTVQRQVRLGFFHFALYFLSFEVVPLLLINKLLFRLLG